MTNDSNMKKEPARRGFLKRAGLIGGAAAAVAGGLGVAAVPYTDYGELDNDFPSIPENQVTLPPNGKSVIVMGGGLSGLQAGVELAARGFKVTVLERTSTPGGKLKSWRDKHFGPANDPNKNDPAFAGYMREHGIHAVWGFYHNLREFLGRYGWPLGDFPNDVSMYNFFDKDGRKSYLPRTSWVPPYDKLQLLDHLTHITHLEEKDRFDAAHLAGRLLSFDYTDEKQRAYLDSMTVVEYGKRLGLSDELIFKICDSFLEMAFYDNVDKASILSLGMLAQIWGGTPRDFMKFNLYANPTNETFLTPMVNFINSHGGEVRYTTEITGLVVENNKMTGVRAAPIPRNAIKRCSICGGLIFDGMEVGGECPYCGAHAEVLRAISDAERTERTFKADFYISAMDGPGAQTLVAQNLEALGNHAYFKNILKLSASAPHVVNLWYEGKGYWEKHVLDDRQKPAFCVYPTGYKFIGITINRSIRIRGKDGTPYTWSSEFPERNVTVIETQIAKSHLLPSTESKVIAMICHEELKNMMPNLPEPSSWYVNRWFNYTCYRVGNEMNRPAIQSPIDNLLYIGDMAFVPSHAVYMEKTNVTAKWAVNLILDRIGQKEGKIKILPVGTPSLSTDAARKVYSVYLPGDEPKT